MKQPLSRIAIVMLIIMLYITLPACTGAEERINQAGGEAISTAQRSLDVDTEQENPKMSISVDDIIVGNSFSISWESISSVHHYEIAIVRMDTDGGSTYITSGTNNRESTGQRTRYTVSASDVPSDTLSFRIYVGAAADAYPCDWTRMIKSNTVTINARYDEEQEMDVSVYVAGDEAEVYWSRVSNADYYRYSVLDMTDGTYVYNQEETTDREFTIGSRDLEYSHEYKIWVAAYSYDSDGCLAQHLAQVVLVTQCGHELTVKDNESGSYKLDEIDDQYHILYNHYDLVCRTCGEVVEENVVESLGQKKHNYSTEGVCTDCFYAGGECEHVSTSPVYTRTEYRPEGKDTHTKIEHFDLVCDYCEAVIPLRNTELYETARTKRTEGLAHSFERNTCGDCGYIRAAELTLTLKRGQASAKVGDMITASLTIAGGSGTYQVFWNVYCGDECVKKDITSGWISIDEHSVNYVADRAGNWRFEALVYDSEDQSTSGRTSAILVEDAGCEHDYEKTLQEQETEYENVNDLQHRVTLTYANVCSLCGDIDGSWVDYIFADHEFDAADECICGAVREKDETCIHDWRSTVSEVRTEQTIRDDRLEKHSVTIVYDDVCGKCGSVSEHETVEYVAHSFDQTGHCACGLIEVGVPCDHATMGAPEGVVAYAYVNDEVHSVTMRERHRCECGAVDELRETVVQVSHTFQEGVCVCGMKEPCRHPASELVWDTRYEAVYTSVSDSEHSCKGYMTEQCIVCKMYTGKTNAVTEIYPHSFGASGVCTDCGYKKVCAHGETVDRYIDTRYTPVDVSYHITEDVYARVCADPACGYLLQQDDASLNVVRQEVHSMVDGQCTACGYADVKPVCSVHGANHIGTTLTDRCNEVEHTEAGHAIWVVCDCNDTKWGYYSTKNFMKCATCEQCATPDVDVVHTEYEGLKLVGVCWHNDSKVTAMTSERRGLITYQTEQRQCRDCGKVFSVTSIVNNEVSDYFDWDFSHFEPKEPIWMTDAQNALESVTIEGHLNIHDYSIQLPYTELHVDKVLDISGSTLVMAMADHITADKVQMNGGSLNVNTLECGKLVISGKDDNLKDVYSANNFTADIANVKEDASFSYVKIVSDKNTVYTIGGDLKFGVGVDMKNDRFQGTIILTGKNPKVSIPTYLEIEKLVLPNTAPFWFSFGKPVKWIDQNEVNAREIVFGVNPSKQDQERLYKLIDEQTKKVEKKGTDISNATATLREKTSSMKDYLGLDYIQEMVAADSKSKRDEFVLAGFFEPQLDRGIKSDDKEKYKEAAYSLFWDAVNDRAFDGNAYRVKETGKLTIDIIAGEGNYTGTYEGEKWVLDFDQMGAGSTSKGQVVFAVCYKAGDDIDNSQTWRYTILGSSSVASVSTVLAEMSNDATREIIQQLVTLTQELFKLTGGVEELEELLVGMLEWEELETSVETLKDYKEKLQEEKVNQIFQEIRGQIGYHIDEIQKAYNTLADIRKEFLDFSEELEDYKNILEFYSKYFE